eukprot:2937621-Rhodomonas_salina.1
MQHRLSLSRNRLLSAEELERGFLISFRPVGPSRAREAAPSAVVQSPPATASTVTSGKPQVGHGTTSTASRHFHATLLVALLVAWAESGCRKLVESTSRDTLILRETTAYGTATVTG